MSHFTWPGLRANRLLAVISLLVLGLFLLAACGGGPAASPTPTQVAAQAATPTTAPEPTTATAATQPAEPTASQPMTDTQAMTETQPMTETHPMTETAHPMGALVMVHEDPALGKILVDANGMTLYAFDKDEKDKSNCTGGCATLWPPLAVTENEQLTAGAGVTGTLGMIERDDGTYQLTINGMPLYHYSLDTKAGDTNGQGVGDVWWVVGADGAKITTMPAPAAAQANPPMPEIHPSSNVSVFASGLDNPRGLKFGPDGALYVAEGGDGGTMTTTAADCEQVPAPVGPYSGGMTAKIAKIDKDGKITVIADKLPSSQTSPQMENLVSGVADVAFIDDTLYALISGAGCSHGLKGTVNSVVKVNTDGTVTQIADLSAYYQANPTKTIEKDDFEPDGTPYSMIEMGGNLYVIEPNHGSLDEITPTGTITRIVDISATEGHIVPTAVVYHDDNFYVGNLSVFPVPEHSATIMVIDQKGQIKEHINGLTAVVGVAFDSQGRLYALETTTVNGQLPVPGTGKVVRVAPATGQLEEIATGLAFPTAMTFGPDGLLYVSNYGFGFPPGKGEIVTIQVP